MQNFVLYLAAGFICALLFLINLNLRRIAHVLESGDEKTRRHLAEVKALQARINEIKAKLDRSERELNWIW